MIPFTPVGIFSLRPTLWEKDLQTNGVDQSTAQRYRKIFGIQIFLVPGDRHIESTAEIPFKREPTIDEFFSSEGDSKGDGLRAFNPLVTI